MKGEQDLTAPILPSDKDTSQKSWPVLPPVSERMGEPAPKDAPDLRLSISSNISTINAALLRATRKNIGQNGATNEEVQKFDLLRKKLGENLDDGLKQLDAPQLAELNEEFKDILKKLFPLTPSVGRLDFKNPA